jgi:dCTP deaminase
MPVKNHRWIRDMATKHKMIQPFEEKQMREGVISSGLSSYGYDSRVADGYKIFTNVNSSVVDPKKFDAKSLVEFTGPECIVPLNSFALARLFQRRALPDYLARIG